MSCVLSMSLRDVYETGFDEDDGKTINRTTCTECDGRLRTVGGETTCTDCGLIVDEYRIDHSATKRSFPGDRGKRTRTGAPNTPARHDRGVSSEIGWKVDANKNRLSSRKRRQLHRLRREHRRARFRSKRERNLAQGCGEIARLVGALDLTRPRREEASVLFRRAQADDLLVGRSIESIAAGSVYAACRCSGELVTSEWVGAVSQCSESKVVHAYGILNTELGLKATLRRPQTFVSNCASACGDVPDAVVHRAIELAGIAEQSGVANGRHPAGVAAACLYLAGRERDAALTQQDVATCADVSPVTLRKRYYELQEEVGCGEDVT